MLERTRVGHPDCAKTDQRGTIMKRESHFEIAAAMHETTTIETMIVGARKAMGPTMLLNQQFQSFGGSLRRAAVENARNKAYRFESVRCFEGEPDNEPIDRSKFELYTWRLRKTLR
jgi:hypothetical protein